MIGQPLFVEEVISEFIRYMTSHDYYSPENFCPQQWIDQQGGWVSAFIHFLPNFKL